MEKSSAVAILCSRQRLRPCSQTAWVRQIQKAIEWLKKYQPEPVILTSVGMITWDIVTASSSRAGLNIRVYLPAEDEIDFGRRASDVSEQFGLSVFRAEFAPVYAPAPAVSKAEVMQIRDQVIVDQADLLIPISINPRGSLQERLDIAEAAGRKVETSFAIDYPGERRRIGYSLDPQDLGPEIKSASSQFITHWTRATNSAWPGERLKDFYSDLLEADRYPRGAFETLCRILDSGLIMASVDHMPGKAPTVCFSSLSPVQLLPLIRYRARYRRMSFEPYGIGIRRRAAEREGIVPVVYCEDVNDSSIDLGERWRFQSIGTKGDWQLEKEHRFLGDFDLSKIAREDLRCFVRFPREAEMIRDRFGIETIPFLAKETATAGI